MSDLLRYTKVAFKRFKAFEAFTLHLRHINIMVGPNNAGKSTVLAAFRILAEGIRKANARKAELVEGLDGLRFGYSVDLKALSVGDENIFFNYHESKRASVTFSLTGGKRLVLYFPETEKCHLFVDDPKKQVRSPSQFRSSFNCPIGFVPILGPVEQDERLYEKETARLALFNYRAARNFRNIWLHYPRDFEWFQSALRETWPGMNIGPPEPARLLEKPMIHMFCTEDRITREIGWTGFGFQVWCQMLTHVVKSKYSSIFLIDEPDIYLHSDLQRKLLSILAELGPYVLIATHSTEIISEAGEGELVLIDKGRKQAKRIHEPTHLAEVFSSLGSTLNPTLTQLTKTRRVVFVEGTDFQILARYARKLGLKDLGYRTGFAVVPMKGFNPDRARILKDGFELALGCDVRAAVVLDRDYRSDLECNQIRQRGAEYCDLVAIHSCKELESFLLVPEAIDRAARARCAERIRRTGTKTEYVDECSQILNAFAEEKETYVEAQFIAFRRKFVLASNRRQADATTTQEAVEAFRADWAAGEQRRLELVPAKEALAAVNQHLQESYGISVTPTGIIDAMCRDEVPTEMRDLLNRLADFVAP